MTQMRFGLLKLVALQKLSLREEAIGITNQRETTIVWDKKNLYTTP
jgi:glycerol kinase